MGGLLTGPTAARHKSGFLAANLKDARVKLTKCCEDGNHLAEVVVDSVAAANEWSFGTHDAGFYLVRTCGGAYSFHATYGWASSRAPALANTPPGNDGWFFRVKYQGPGGDTYATDNSPSIANGYYGYASEAEASQSGCGRDVVFEHCGGAIKIAFADNPYTDNMLGTPGPTYRLYAVDPSDLFRIDSTTATRLGANHFQCVFVLSSKYNAPVTADMSLSIAGGTSVNPSSQSVTVPSGSTTSATFDWYGDPSGNTVMDITVTLAFTCVDSSEVYEIALEPIIAASNAVNLVGSLCGFEGVTGSRVIQFRTTNSGNFPTNALVATVTAVSGAQLLNAYPACSVASSVAVSIATLNPGLYDTKTFDAVPTPGATSAVFDIAYTDGPVTHPPSRITISW